MADPSPYVELDRHAWSALAPATPLQLTEEDLASLRGLGEPIDLAEVQEVYLPLSRLLQLYVEAARALHAARAGFLGEQTTPTTFVVGIAGSVAVGKSTTARVLREVMARWPGTRRVELLTTDGFLRPNAELQKRGLLERKGFPESY
ncbi:type I pantothenate kinase, partial [Pseudokineococcus sp. 1T1Z-3]|uniref:type I pantothenate kinase n=1 Tax=Pseudokineococcus sp. 1T1Z-3 TaxID=3132745 RepID=UPI0030A23EE9